MPCFYLSVLYFNRNITEVSSYNYTLPLYTGAQPVSRCACPSCRCQPLEQPVWHGQPMGSLSLHWCSMVPQTEPSVLGTNLWGVLLALRSPCSSRCLDVTQLGLHLAERIYSRGRVWSIPQRAAEIHPLRPNMKPELPTSFSAVSMSQVHLPLLHKKKNLGDMLCSLPRFLLELWHLVWRSIMVPA